MKKQTRNIMLTAGFLAALFVSVPQETMAGPLVQGGECIIETEQDFEGSVSGKGATFRLAVKSINASTHQSQRQCQGGIKIKTERIYFTRPIYFEIPVEETSDNSPYVIAGEKADKPVIFNFSQVVAPAGDAKDYCVITIKNTNNLILKNIKIAGAPASGICIGSLEDNKAVNKITFDNVHVENAAGHGFIFRERAVDNLLLSNSSVKTAGGDGVKILGINTNQFSPIQATNRTVARDNNGNDKIDPETGLARFDELPPLTTQNDFGIFSIQSDASFVSSEADARVLVTEISQQDGKYKVAGAVVKRDLTCSNAVIPYSDQKLIEEQVQNVKRIHVYAIVTDAEGNSGAKFLTYVVACPAKTNCLHGIGSAGSAFGANFGGLFSFLLDTQGDTISRIVLVPELSNGVLVTSSAAKDLGYVNDRDVCKDPDSRDTGDDSGGQTVISDDSIAGPGDIIIGWNSIDQCKLARQVNLDFDTDGDGIPDVYEDTNNNCQYDADVDFSDWTNADTDGDGIPDGAELNGVPYTEINRQRGPTNPAICNTSVHRVDASGVSYDPCDVDGDGKSNANDLDSDGDGLFDYQEDRDRFFIENRKAYYYRWQGVGGAELIKINGQAAECTGELEELGLKHVGVSYGIYKVKRSLKVSPQRLTSFMGTSTAPDEVLLRLTCRNASVTALQNFNGKKDGPTETDPYKSDKVGDTVCRGMPDLARNGECRIECKDGDIFQGMSDTWVDRDSMGRATGLKKESDGTPLIFSQPNDIIRRECTDVDEDGIPDCVENPTGSCNACPAIGQAERTGNTAVAASLCPYTRDTDGDGAPDNIDLNPFVSNKVPALSDLYPARDDDPRMTEDIRNTLRYVFQNNVHLARFVDRDQDGLFDAQEDHNRYPGQRLGELNTTSGMSGTGAPIPGSNDPRLITETDPLKRDTDGDGIDDYTEVITWERYTNPYDRDTDGDGLPDSFEVINLQHNPNRSYVDQTGQGCTGLLAVQPGQTMDDLIAKTKISWFVGAGTDPANPDTDGDGLKDGVELTGTIFDGLLDLTQFRNGQFPVGGVHFVTNPLSSDSNGDGRPDSEHLGGDGKMGLNGSNPCVEDDRDGDGLPDHCEIMLGTNRELQDTDGDGLSDGEEDLNKNCRRDPNETDPLNPDTDGDHLSDGLEKQLGTNPLTDDSDGDCITDEKELGLVTPELLSAASTPAANCTVDNTSGCVVFNLVYTPGTHTDPLNPDSDGDGLCDGKNPVNALDGTRICIRGEDLNCNGIHDRDPNNPNILLETDPRNWDTSGDGISDMQALCAGGVCNIAANIGRATAGRSQGCFSLGANGPASPAGMLYVFGVLVMMNRMWMLKLRGKKKK